MSYSYIVDRVIEPSIIYAGAIAHYLAQAFDLLDAESTVNIVLGLCVIGYTLLKIVQIIIELRNKNNKSIARQIKEAIDEFKKDNNMDNENPI